MATQKVINKPKLEDPNHVREIFACEISDIGFIDGNFVVTLATTRIDEPRPNQDPIARRIVVGRIALTRTAASQMLNKLGNISNQLNALTSKPAMPAGPAN